MVFPVRPTSSSRAAPSRLIGTTIPHSNQQEHAARPSLWHFRQTMPLFIGYLVPDRARHYQILILSGNTEGRRGLAYAENKPGNWPDAIAPPEFSGRPIEQS